MACNSTSCLLLAEVLSALLAVPSHQPTMLSLLTASSTEVLVATTRLLGCTWVEAQAAAEAEAQVQGGGGQTRSQQHVAQCFVVFAFSPQEDKPQLTHH